MNKNLYLTLIVLVSLMGMPTLCLAYHETTSLNATSSYRQRIDLKGRWGFALDRDSTGISRGFPGCTFEESVTLPGTTDTNCKGDALTDKTVTTRLSRRYSYVGKAWYERTINIPQSWKGKHITLTLERTKPTKVFIDGKTVGSCDDISVAQVYQLTPMLTPGTHHLSIMVDNGKSVPEAIIGNSHAYTEDTQTNWNGIIGQIYLEAADSHLRILSVKTNPNITDNTIDIEMSFTGFSPHTMVSAETDPVGWSDTSASMTERATELNPLNNADGTTTLRFSLNMGNGIRQWNEFHPNLYRLNVELCDDHSPAQGDDISMNIGMRKMEAKGNHFYINGQMTFLRGKHDACVFPLTGHVAMDKEQWRHYLSTARDYGINHIRFHSWCPPEACFEAADELGIYLQPELPIWGGFDKKSTQLMAFLKDEGRKIIQAYGNHPSFVMMGLGNELWGDETVMADFVSDFRSHDEMNGKTKEESIRRLYTFGSNMFLGYKGYFKGMDYFTTCRIGGEAWGQFNTHVRGSFAFSDVYDGGIINHERPNTTTNFEQAIKGCPIPVISHETGQFQSYPDYRQISKYTGVLEPCNLEIFRQRLHDAHMDDQALDFHKASLWWAQQLYKADIEMDLRTGNMAGFQLLDLQDYPGQGSAYVGILDAFMDAKGKDDNIIEAKKWRQWCCEVVPMAEMDRRIFVAGDTIRWTPLIANYAECDSILRGKSLYYRFTKANGDCMAQGCLTTSHLTSGLNRLTTVETTTAGHGDKPETLTLSLSIEGTSYKNDYHLWLYPSTDYLKEKKRLCHGICISDTLDERTMHLLAKGRKVLLMPRRGTYPKQTMEGLTQTDYWNYRMFKTISENNNKPVSPGTLGLLVNDERHPMLADFPTRYYSDWQWASIAHEARPLVMDQMPEGFKPTVQVIDNIERNHKLGLIFEMAVGKGRLLVCMSDLSRQEDKPEARQLMLSLLRYMQSQAFKPSAQCQPTLVKSLFTNEARQKGIQELRNISYD